MSYNDIKHLAANPIAAASIVGTMTLIGFGLGEAVGAVWNKIGTSPRTELVAADNIPTRPAIIATPDGKVLLSPQAK